MRVLVADDHSIIRRALAYVVADVDAGAGVTEAWTFDQVRAVVTEGPRPDLVVFDLRMPGCRDMDDLRWLVETADPAPVVVFSMLEDPTDMRAALATGVRAYIPKSTDHGLIGNILRLVLAGGTYVPPALGAATPGEGETMQGEAAPPDEVAPAGPLDDLTPRQREVLALMAEGRSNQAIADRLGLNLSTVKSHVTAILRAFDARSRTQAVLTYNRLMEGG